MACVYYYHALKYTLPNIQREICVPVLVGTLPVYLLDSVQSDLSGTFYLSTFCQAIPTFDFLAGNFYFLYLNAINICL